MSPADFYQKEAEPLIKIYVFLLVKNVPTRCQYNIHQCQRWPW
jgi:hypothetical protein